MMDYTFWRYTFLLFILYRISVSQAFREVKNCKGTNWTDTKVSIDVAQARYKIMQDQFTGCTHVKGNVEITWQQNASLDFSFMKDIVDVSGYVLVTKSYIPFIPLPKLIVIRGETLFKDNALYVSYNYNETSSDETIAERSVGLLQLQLVSLREILNGGVLIYENSELCYAATIDWTDILANGSEYEVTFPFIKCNDCSLNCTGGCWGAGPNMCQTLNKNVCDPSCANRCFGPESNQCCNSTCVGGCTATTPYDCLACRKSIYEDKCVDSCPVDLLLDEGKCVEACRERWTAIDGVCVECGDDCPNTCVGNDFTYKNNFISFDSIETFKHCTIVERNVIITRETFAGHLYEGIIGIPYEKLRALENIQVIKGYLSIVNVDKQNTDMSNLTFLRNLREVHGDELDRNGASIAISSVNTIKTLSLSSFQLAKKGDVHIQNNDNLCLSNEQKWINGLLADDQIQNIDISGNQDTLLCENEGYVCDAECLGGCWGLGSENCFLCYDYELDGSCVKACNTSLGQYITDEVNQLCGYCHAECAGTCTGPGSSDCLACKNVLDVEKCKPECPEFKYQNADKVCSPCHENCVLGCTGESSLKLEGGCDKCYVTRIDINDNVIQQSSGFTIFTSECLARDATCDEHYHEIKAIAGARICRECDSICRTCSGISSNCTSCRLLSIDNQCVAGCGLNQFVSNDRCQHCDEQCNNGCKGPTARDCKTCARAQIDFKGGVFECVQSCPKDLKEGVCNDGSDNVVGIVVGLVTAVLSIIVMLILILYCYFRRKKESKEFYDLPAAVEVPLHDAKFNRVTARASGRAPNKAKLTIIKQTEIIKGSELGSGAFGTVYSGFWVPDNKRFRIPVAIKVLQDLSPSSSDELLSESGVMATVEHRCVLRLLAVCMSEPMMMVTQLMPLGSLLDYIRKNHDQIGAYHLLNWSMQISEGMEYLESKHLIHRDLAARNVLVQSPNQVKITDFGLAKFLDVDEQKFLAEGGKVAVKWLAPECLKYALFTHESDVWSFGVTIWELMTFGTKPYEGYRAREILDLIDKGERLKQPPICTIDVYMLLLKCWVIDPNARPKFSYLVDEFGKMAQDPQRFVVIENDDEKQLPTFNKEEFYSDFFDDKDVLEDVLEGGSTSLVEAEDYLTPMEMSTENTDGIPTFEAEYVNEEPVNHYQDLITAKMEESEDELESGRSGLRGAVGMNADAPPIPPTPDNFGDYMGLSEVTEDSMAIGPYLDNPEYHSLNVLQSSPTLQSKNPWDRKPTGPKENKKAKNKKGAKNDTCEDNGLSSDDPLMAIRPRAVSNVYVDDQMQVMTRPEESSLMNGRVESSV